MIPVNATYDNLRDAGAGIEWRVTNGNSTFDITKIVDGKLSMSSMKNVSIGNCVASQLDLTLWGSTIDASNPLVLQFRATSNTGSSSAWYNKGTFFVDTLEKDPYSEKTKVKAFDAMLKAEVGYMASGVWVNPTDKAVLDNIKSDMGVSVEGENTNPVSGTYKLFVDNPTTLTNAPHIGENGTTDREMLSYIGIMRGGNWIINSDNELQLIFPSATPDNTANVDLAVMKFASDDTLTVSKVRINLSDDTYYLAPSNITEEAWKELAGYCIEADLPIYGSQSIADALLTQYDGKSFIPYTAKSAYADPKYEVGDGIRFKKDSTYYTTLIVDQTMTVNWLCKSDLSLEGEERVNSMYPYLSPRERQTLYQFGELEESISDVSTVAGEASAAVGNAAMNVQTIYKSAVSGTTTLSPNTTWVTYAVGDQNTWTTTRPVYDSNYPIVFRAIQTQSVEQSSGQECSCTDPAIDTTTTIIDGSHIITGTIDATKITAGSLSVGCFDENVQGSLSNADAAMDLASDNADEINNMHGYMQYSPDTATLTLGDQNSQFKAELSNTELAFKQNNAKVAYISNSKLFITDTEVKNSMRLGKYEWVIDNDENSQTYGRMSLKWVN